MRCLNCNLVYVKPQHISHSIITNGPVVSNRQHETTPPSVEEILEHSWEGVHLKTKQAEYAASYFNHIDALARLERFQKPPGRLLDFGCGGGFFLNTAQQRGWQIFGLEPLYGHAVHAQGKFGAQIVNDTLHPDTFEADFFDVITAFQVFEHLVNPLEVLRQLTHFLKPGGVLLVEVPNIDTWSVRLLGKRHRHFVHDHLYFFSPRTLQMLFQSANLAMLNVYYPTRRMSLQHLVGSWGTRLLPKRMAPALQKWAQESKAAHNIISLNLHDIVAIIGRKN